MHFRDTGLGLEPCIMVLLIYMYQVSKQFHGIKKGKKLAKVQVKVTEFGLRVGMMVKKAFAKFQSNILRSYSDYDGVAPKTLTPWRTLFVGHLRFLLIIWYQVVCID